MKASPAGVKGQREEFNGVRDADRFPSDLNLDELHLLNASPETSHRTLALNRCVCFAKRSKL
jgi:hypothetical protein